MELTPVLPPLAMRTTPLESAAEQLAETRRRDAFEGLEAMFIHTLLKEMRKSIPDDGILQRSSGRKQMEDLMDEMMARELAKSGQLGVARMVEQQLAQADRAIPPGSVEPSRIEPLKSALGRADNGVGAVAPKGNDV